MLAFPIAGLPWHWFRHVRIAVSADRIGTGLQGLAGVLVPYLGPGHGVRLVIVLGAAVLLLDAAVVLAFAPRAVQRGDARRAGAALPLVALAVVPSTLVRPQLPYLQGLVLFALLAAFMWGDRVRRGAAGAALVARRGGRGRRRGAGAAAGHAHGRGSTTAPGRGPRSAPTSTRSTGTRPTGRCTGRARATSC